MVENKAIFGVAFQFKSTHIFLLFEKCIPSFEERWDYDFGNL